MSFNNSFSAVTGATYLASQYNTYVRDNLASIWVGTAAGDIEYYASSSTKQKIAAPSAKSLLFFDYGVSGVPKWLTDLNSRGVIHTQGYVRFSPGQTFAGGAADVSGATLTLTLAVQCKIILLAFVTGYNTLAGAGRSFFVIGVIDGTSDPNYADIFNGSNNPARNEDLAYMYYKTGVAVGSRIIKLQCAADSNANVVTAGHMLALAIPE